MPRQPLTWKDQSIRELANPKKWKKLTDYEQADKHLIIEALRTLRSAHSKIRKKYVAAILENNYLKRRVAQLEQQKAYLFKERRGLRNFKSMKRYKKRGER